MSNEYVTAFLEHYGTITTQIGKGSYSKVYLTDKNYVIKVQSSTKDTLRVLIKEIACLDYLKFSNYVIKMYDYYLDFNQTTDNKSYIVLEQATTDLQNLIEDKLIPTTEFKKVAFQIVLGLADIHHSNILHRDLKPDNILYVNDTFKIADFGLAIPNVCPHLEYINEVYTIMYRPPELLFAKEGATYTFSADIWALGMILYELFTQTTNFIWDLNLLKLPVGNYPKYADFVEGNYQNYIIKGNNDNTWRMIGKNMLTFLNHKKYFLNQVTDLGMRKLLTKIFKVNPLKRYTIDQIIADPYFGGQITELKCFDKYIQTSKVVDTSYLSFFTLEHLNLIQNILTKYIEVKYQQVLLEAIKYLYAETHGFIHNERFIITSNGTQKYIEANGFEDEESLIITLMMLIISIYDLPIASTSYTSAQVAILYTLGRNLIFSIPQNFKNLLDSGYPSISAEIDYISSHNLYIYQPLASLMVDTFRKHGVLDRYTNLSY